MIINLDEVVTQDKIVRLGGRDLRVANNLPLSMILKLMKQQKKLQEDSEDIEAIEESFKILYDCLCLLNDGLDWEWFESKMTMKSFIILSQGLFSDMETIDNTEEKKTAAKIVN